MTKHNTETLAQLERWFTEFAEASSHKPDSKQQLNPTDTYRSVDVSPISKRKNTFKARFKRITIKNKL